MPYIPPEVVARAREMDLLTYLRTYEPQELVHFGGGTYCTREHDSLKISNGKWCWFSRGIGGYSALDYLVKVKEMPFMGNLSAAPPAFAPASKAPKEKVLLLPQVNRSATHAVKYLHRRGIDYELIDFCIKTGRLYESYPYHNVVFVGMDADGKPRYANEGSARTSSGTPTAAISTIPLESLHRPQATRSTCLSQQWICYPTGYCKSWTAKTGVTKTCSPSPGSTSQGRKSKKAACPPHWCGILPNIAA